MKRYWVFSGDIYYPGGGFHDINGTYDTLEEAVAACKGFVSYGNLVWSHVLDTKHMKIVFEDNHVAE